MPPDIANTPQGAKLLLVGQENGKKHSNLNLTQADFLIHSLVHLQYITLHAVTVVFTKHKYNHGILLLSWFPIWLHNETTQHPENLYQIKILTLQLPNISI